MTSKQSNNRKVFGQTCVMINKWSLGLHELRHFTKVRSHIFLCLVPCHILNFRHHIYTHPPSSDWSRAWQAVARNIQPPGNQPITSPRTNNQYQARPIRLVQRESSNLNHVTYLESKARPSFGPKLVFVSLPFRYRLTVFLGHSWENFSKSQWLVPQEKMQKVRRLLRDSRRTENLREIAFLVK